jgi:hypothetical protein
MPNQTGEGYLVIQTPEGRRFDLATMTGRLSGGGPAGTTALRDFYYVHAAAGTITGVTYEPPNGTPVPATLTTRHDQARNSDDVLVSAGGRIVVALLGTCSSCEKLGHCYACDQHGRDEREHWCPVDQTFK